MAGFILQFFFIMAGYKTKFFKSVINFYKLSFTKIKKKSIFLDSVVTQPNKTITASHNQHDKNYFQN